MHVAHSNKVIRVALSTHAMLCVIFLMLQVCKMLFKYKLDILESLRTMPVSGSVAFLKRKTSSLHTFFCSSHFSKNFSSSRPNGTFRCFWKAFQAIGGYQFADSDSKKRDVTQSFHLCLVHHLGQVLPFVQVSRCLLLPVPP